MNEKYVHQNGNNLVDESHHQLQKCLSFEGNHNFIPAKVEKMNKKTEMGKKTSVMSFMVRN